MLSRKCFTGIFNVLFLAFYIMNAYSQNKSDSVFILPELKIYSRKDYTSFEKYGFNKFLLTDSTIIADPKRYRYSIRLFEVKQVSFQSGRDFWGGAKIGGAVGFVLGFLFWGFFDLDPEPKWETSRAFFGGVITCVPFALAGGLVGLLAPAYDDYDLQKIPKTERRKYLQKVFRKYQIR